MRRFNWLALSCACVLSIAAFAGTSISAPAFKAPAIQAADIVQAVAAKKKSTAACYAYGSVVCCGSKCMDFYTKRRLTRSFCTVSGGKVCCPTLGCAPIHPPTL